MSTIDVLVEKYAWFIDLIVWAIVAGFVLAAVFLIISIVDMIKSSKQDKKKNAERAEFTEHVMKEIRKNWK